MLPDSFWGRPAIGKVLSMLFEKLHEWGDLFPPCAPGERSISRIPVDEPESFQLWEMTVMNQHASGFPPVTGV